MEGVDCITVPKNKQLRTLCVIFPDLGMYPIGRGRDRSGVQRWNKLGDVN
jgi:hypothetical protein